MTTGVSWTYVENTCKFLRELFINVERGTSLLESQVMTRRAAIVLD